MQNKAQSEQVTGHSTKHTCSTKVGIAAHLCGAGGAPLVLVLVHEYGGEEEELGKEKGAAEGRPGLGRKKENAILNAAALGWAGRPVLAGEGLRKDTKTIRKCRCSFASQSPHQPIC